MFKGCGLLIAIEGLIHLSLVEIVRSANKETQVIAIRGRRKFGIKLAAVQIVHPSHHGGT